jgi:hypoxanthine-DNA glycosylase
MLKRSFAPVVDAGARLLVLGSLPGEVSLARAEYYAHPQNQFWRLMEAVIDRPLAVLDYDERLATLRSAAVGLWDVVGSARRAGSLDGDLRDVQPNALAELVETLPQLRTVAFNGLTAARIGRRQLAALPEVSMIDLPSSSPAYTVSLPAKRAAWLALRASLADGALTR